MPFYTVEHSYPLTSKQKSQLAADITHLHTSKFLVPSLFVHVIFKASDASNQNYFIAGKPRVTSTNRITGLVRTAPSRTKEDWEELAEQFEHAWYTAVSGEVIDEGKNEGKRKDALDDTEKDTNAKTLLAVAFHGILGVRENGNPVPVVSTPALGSGDEKDVVQLFGECVATIRKIPRGAHSAKRWPKHLHAGAGEEAAWLKKYHDEFQRKADAGNELYQGLLEEVSTREDLKKAYGT